MRPITFSAASQIYESCKLSVLPTTNKALSTEIFELDVSHGSLSAKLLNTKGGQIAGKLEILAGKVPPSFIRTLAKDLTWTLDHLDSIVKLIVSEQSKFICGGREISQLRPIGLSDIAKKIGLHASIVSRLMRQVTVVINGEEFPISVLLPSSRLGSMKVREAVRELARDPEYCDGKRWLFTAGSLRLVLQDLTGETLTRRTVSKYIEETGFQAGYRKGPWKPSDEYGRQAWRMQHAELNFSAGTVSGQAMQAAKNFEVERLRELNVKIEQLCASLSVEDVSLAETYVSLAAKYGFVLVPAGKSLMLKTEPWSSTLLYFMPGRGLILASQNILKATKGEAGETSLEAYASILGLNVASLERKECFVHVNRITKANLSQLLFLLASSMDLALKS